MNRYATISWALLRDRFRNEKAYIGNFWAELGSTTLFVITFIIFSDLLFKRIGSFAGYTLDEFLFMVLIGQATFYAWALIMFPAFNQLIASVRTGSFDQLLTKPISTKFYVYAAAFRPLYGLFVTVPNLLILIWVINWSNISTNLSAVAMGTVVWLAGLLILNTIMLGLAYPVFTQGDATDMLNSAFSLFAITQVPFQQLPGFMKALSFVALPTILATAGSTYVILQKGPALSLLIASLVAGILAVLCFNIIWRKAMANYSSASS